MEKVLNFAWVTPKWTDNQKGYEFGFESIKVKETEKQYKIIEVNPNLFLDFGSVIKKDELFRAVNKANPMTEVGTTIVDGSLADAKFDLMTKITANISFINKQIQVRANSENFKATRLLNKLEDCTKQLTALYN